MRAAIGVPRGQQSRSVALAGQAPGIRQVSRHPQSPPAWASARFWRPEVSPAFGELKAFLAGRDEWPRHAEFVETGDKGLYQAVLSHGGSQCWAQRMGVTRPKRHGGSPPYWTDERVRRRLKEMLAGSVDWPRVAEFVAAGEVRLLDAVRRRGGVKHWAAQLGLLYTPRGRNDRTGSDGRIRSWDDDRIASAISPLIEELGRWPTKSEFRAEGLSKALAAVYEHGGSARWQQRFGVVPRDFDGRLPDRQRWTSERVEAELREFCAGRETWPTFREFQAADRYALYRAAGRYGGMKHWRECITLRTSSAR